METAETAPGRIRWSSERAFVLAMAAAAVGLGNIWRFPYMAGENGGAAFIVAYLVAVLALGLPLMLVELGAGSLAQGGVVRTFRAVHPRAGAFGWFVLSLTVVILSYYLVVTGWTLGYAVDSVRGDLRTFDSFTDGAGPVAMFGAALAVSAVVAFRGVALIERLSRLLMPLLVLVILGLAGYGLTMDGREEALGFLFSPDFTDFTSPRLWVLAFGQAFYSLAIGQGYLMTYGSSLPEGVNLPRAATAVTAIETGIALVAGLMIFPIVFSFGMDPSEGTELAFSTLPLAFDDMAVGPVLAVVFFSLFFLAAISSCIASMKVIKTTLVEELRLDDIRAVLVAVGLLLPLGLLSAVSFTPFEVEFLGRPFLEFMDVMTANQVVILSGLVGGALLSWFTPRQVILNFFPERLRILGLHTVRAVRYLWLGVLVVLVASMLL
jgi:neurotransmitter:Na+ symporter, NSS family